MTDRLMHQPVTTAATTSTSDSGSPAMTSTDPTVRYVAAPARTDVSPPAPSPAAPPDGATGVAAGAVRLVGGAVAVSSAAWALSFSLGLRSEAVLGTVLAVAFQGALLALLTLVWRTRGTGERRAGRILLGAEIAVLAVATVQSASEAIPGAIADTLTAVLDPFWPLSMLGMLAVGITVGVVGRWRGLARVWAVVATTWILALPIMMLGGPLVGELVATGHVLLGYVVLGILLVVRPDSVRG